MGDREKNLRQERNRSKIVVVVVVVVVVAVVDVAGVVNGCVITYLSIYQVPLSICGRY